jgi:DHA2 family methylenomycin A resistance protein-like MFS transporter
MPARDVLPAPRGVSIDVRPRGEEASTPTPSGASRSRSVTLVAMSLGFVVVQLDVTVVNVALKQIEASFGGGVVDLQWVVNAYTLSFAALLLTAGRLGDRYGSKRAFMAGFAVFTAASLACGLSPTLGVLITARAMQGIGAAMLVPCSLALLNHAYPDPAERLRAVAFWAAGASMALAAGPLVGGALIAVIGGWRSIFFINVPIGVVGILLTWRHATETPPSRDRGLDVGGQVTAIAALLVLAASLIEAGNVAWPRSMVVAGFALGALLAATFVRVERRATRPMLPLSLFGDPTFAAASLVGLLVNVAFYGLIFALGLFFQDVKGYSAAKTGAAFIPMTASIFFANLGASALVKAIGPRPVIVAGEGLLASGCFLLAALGPGASYVALAAPLLAMGAGVGLVVPPLTSALLGTVAPEQSGIASGVLNTMRQTGSVIGVALLGSLAGTHGLRSALLLAGGVVVVGCVAAAWIGARRRGADARDKR